MNRNNVQGGPKRGGHWLLTVFLVSCASAMLMGWLAMRKNIRQATLEITRRLNKQASTELASPQSTAKIEGTGVELVEY